MHHAFLYISVVSLGTLAFKGCRRRYCLKAIVLRVRVRVRVRVKMLIRLGLNPSPLGLGLGLGLVNQKFKMADSLGEDSELSYF